MSRRRTGRPWAALACAVGAVALGATDARADVWASVGVAETVAVPSPEHFGVYGYAGATIPIAAGDFYVIPGLGFEWCPECSRGGGIAAITLERAATPRVAIDLSLSLIHDQAGLAWSDALFSLGVGGGVSVPVGRFVVSPSLTLYRVLDGPGWSLAPAIGLSHQLF